MREAEMYACHPLPLATRRHFTDKISSKRKQNNPPSRKNQKTPTYRQSLFTPRILQLRKKRRIRPLEILKKDRKKKSRSVTTKTPQTRTPQKRRNRRARDSTTNQKSSGKKLLFETFSKHHETKRRKIWLTEALPQEEPACRYALEFLRCIKPRCDDKPSSFPPT